MILVAVFAGLTLPITPVQILWINMTTAVLLGLMLAFEGKEPGSMQRPPRKPDMPVLTRELGIRVGMVSLLLVLGAFGLFEWVLAESASVETARTVAVNVFVCGELFYLFNCRSLRYSMFRIGIFSNRWLVLGVSLMIGLQLMFTYLPTMNTLFGSAPIGVEHWFYIVLVGLVIYLVVETEKALRRRKEIGALK